MFDLNGKIALVTGGASGIGLCYIKELIRSGVKGVTLVDINSASAQKTLDELGKEFGSNRVQFVKADVSDIQQLEDAFKKTVETFGYIDIVINNAGTFNDRKPEIEIAINFTGVVNGILLGLENYLPKHRQGPEALIVNTASIYGLDFAPGSPIYSGTKAAVVALTRCWGDPYHYERTKVRLFAVCPGVTLTPMITDTVGRTLGPAYDDWIATQINVSQAPEHVAQEMIKLMQTSPSGSVWVIEDSEPACEYFALERKVAPK